MIKAFVIATGTLHCSTKSAADITLISGRVVVAMVVVSPSNNYNTLSYNL